LHAGGSAPSTRSATGSSRATSPSIAGRSDIRARSNRRNDRKRLIEEIEEEARLVTVHTHRPKYAPRVLAALARVPRHEFVPATLRDAAYANAPLPIGYQQTISQPFIVALMTDLLDLDETSRVLEIGTGSGYQCAVLAEIAGEVFSIEIVEPLARSAEGHLRRLGYDNATVRAGDGYQGWRARAIRWHHLPAPEVPR
jgi:protein-L-isoaspartate(D-aspartate) O-methyltransferase